MDPIDDLIGEAIDFAIEDINLPNDIRTVLRTYKDASSFIDLPYSVEGFFRALNADSDQSYVAQLELVSLRNGLEVIRGELTRSMISQAAQNGPYSQEDWDRLTSGIHDSVATYFGPIEGQVDGYITGFGARVVVGEVSDFFSGAAGSVGHFLGATANWVADQFRNVFGFDQCFVAGTPIDMWPLDPEFAPDPANPHKPYDQAAVRANIWTKRIEQIEVGDIVVSFDENDNLVPGPITRTFQNDVKILLDLHGTRVTPGHVYYRPDSKKSYKYETLIDLLRDDGVIQHQDGTLIRAATNVPVGSPRDSFVRTITGTPKADGTVEQKDAGRIRLGTRVLVGSGKARNSWAVADLIEAGGGVVGEDELIRVGEGPGMPFHWEFGDTLPRPEDFVLACSGTTLEDIYKAAEWESQGPRLPTPMVLDRGPVQPLKGAELSAMARNEPLDVEHAPRVPAKPPGRPNRKPRKAMEAKQRKDTKPQRRTIV